MHKLFEKACKNRGYEVSNNNMVLFNVNGVIYQLEYRYGNIVSFSRKISDNTLGRWLLLESECFSDCKDKNEFRKVLNYYLGYLEKKYYLIEKEQMARNELLSQIESETNKSIKGDRELEEFVLKVYKMGSDSNIAC